MDLSTLFNHNRSMFFIADEQGRVSFRGRYLSEFKESEYSTQNLFMTKQISFYTAIL